MKKFVEEILEKAASKKYDFNINDLDLADVNEIKTLAREKRLTYGNAPIGRDLFRFISEREDNLNFKLAEFNNKKIDAMLFIPTPHSKRAYVILNSSQMLVNQIFAAAHEYYHYIKDFENLKTTPKLCNLELLETKSEKKASRFAAEFLLPSDALRMELDLFMERFNYKAGASFTIQEIAVVCIALVLKYELPLKSVIYRLIEERCIKYGLEELMENYNSIKAMMLELQKYFKNSKYKQLFENENLEIPEENLYEQLMNVYNCGLLSKNQIEEDAEELNLDVALIKEILAQEDGDQEDDDEEEIDKIYQAWSIGQ